MIVLKGEIRYEKRWLSEEDVEGDGKGTAFGKGVNRGSNHRGGNHRGGNHDYNVDNDDGYSAG